MNGRFLQYMAIGVAFTFCMTGILNRSVSDFLIGAAAAVFAFALEGGIKKSSD
jgi:branched-subunit amino acid ABC-type transport system permease component